MCLPTLAQWVGLSALMWLCPAYSTKLYLSALRASLRPAKFRKSGHERHIPLLSLSQRKIPSLNKEGLGVVVHSKPTNLKDVIIIGGGLAGLINAIKLSAAGLDVLLIEKKSYPFHKVCGEYISNEVLPYLKRINADPEILQPKQIKRMTLSHQSGASTSTQLPLGGFSVRRYTLDEYLYQIAQKNGCEFLLNEGVQEVYYEQDEFAIVTKQNRFLKARIVIGAYGKRSVVDNMLKRDFFQVKSPYIGVKRHFKADYPDDLVGLHHFKNGYCGLSKVENEEVNVCYLTTAANLKKYGTTDALEQELLSQNKHLKTIFQEGEAVQKKPLVISQVSFLPKNIVEHHILMAGDAAGLISPLCGNGMAMAIHSAKICSELVIQYFEKKISRKQLEKNYAKTWNKQFANRLMVGRQTQKLFFASDQLSSFSFKCLNRFPVLLPKLISLTHGKPL